MTSSVKGLGFPSLSWQCLPPGGGVVEGGACTHSSQCSDTRIILP